MFKEHFIIEANYNSGDGWEFVSLHSSKSVADIRIKELRMSVPFASYRMIPCRFEQISMNFENWSEISPKSLDMVPST